jgi:hypothetical protein
MLPDRCATCPHKCWRFLAEAEAEALRAVRRRPAPIRIDTSLPAAGAWKPDEPLRPAA